jgi:peptidyl-prolyl cis-trans isomerase C
MLFFSASRRTMSMSKTFFASAAALGVATLSVALLAAATPDIAHRAGVVATVGGHTVTTGDIEDRIASIPLFQLAQFGLTADVIRRAITNDVLVPDALYVAGAEARKLGQRLPTSYEVKRALSNATLRASRESVSPAISRYAQPERFSVWRILCKTREDAIAVLAAAKKDPTPQAFTVLARERSQDKATYLRSGNLGFLSIDGASNEAGLRVDAAVVKAATTVRDGELVPSAVPEGDGFAVVWRRGTVAATRRTFEDAAPQIRDTLFRQRVEQAQKKLLDDLRTKNLSMLNEALINTLEIAPETASVIPRKRAAQAAPSGAASSRP